MLMQQSVHFEQLSPHTGDCHALGHLREYTLVSSLKVDDKILAIRRNKYNEYSFRYLRRRRNPYHN